MFISRRFQVIEFDRSNPMLKVALFVLMMVGVLILLTGFLGCCGAWKESTKMLFLVSTEGGLREYGGRTEGGLRVYRVLREY